ncbi:hypothetical protein ACFL2C_01660 [Patescibacteria group bacterium]
MKKSRQPGVVTLAILTALTVILWVFFSVYRALTEELPSQVSPEILEPVNPSLDLETLKKVREGLTFTDIETENISVSTPDVVSEDEETAEETGGAVSEGLEEDVSVPNEGDSGIPNDDLVEE